jgi:hypothetical protein
MCKGILLTKTTSERKTPMLRILFVFAFLFSFLPSRAGILSQLVQQRAQTKNPKQFVAFADSVCERKLLYLDRTIQWDCQKDNSQFIGSYWQIGFRFVEMGLGRKDEFTDVYMFITTDTLFYCEVRNSMIGGDSGLFYHYIDSLTMKKLSRTWEKTYGVELKLTDFDSLDYNYGFHCGIDGVRTEGRLLLDEMVRQRDTVRLNQWLQSPLPGRQAYAVDGFYQLSKRGTWLSAQQKKRIAAVQSRDAALSFCVGCVYSIKRLKDVTKSFVF